MVQLLVRVVPTLANCRTNTCLKKTTISTVSRLSLWCAHDEWGWWLQDTLGLKHEIPNFRGIKCKNKLLEGKNWYHTWICADDNSQELVKTTAHVLNKVQKTGTTLTGVWWIIWESCLFYHHLNTHLNVFTCSISFRLLIPLRNSCFSITRALAA